VLSLAALRLSVLVHLAAALLARAALGALLSFAVIVLRMLLALTALATLLLAALTLLATWVLTTLVLVRHDILAIDSRH